MPNRVTLAYAVDRSHSVPLCDAGLHGYLLAVLVSQADSRTLLALVQVDATGKVAGLCRDAECELVTHEQPGPLPDEWAERVKRVVRSRCGHPTKSGSPCRQSVARPGGACAWHRHHIEVTHEHQETR